MAEGKGEELEGRAKEAVGDLTGDESLEREGRVEQASGTIKQKLSGLVDRLKSVVRRRT